MARAEIDLTMLRPLIDHKDDSKVVRWIMNQLKTKTKTPSTGTIK
jgi:hypothetical protein